MLQKPLVEPLEEMDSSMQLKSVKMEIQQQEMDVMLVEQLKICGFVVGELPLLQTHVLNVQEDNLQMLLKIHVQSNVVMD